METTEFKNQILEKFKGNVDHAKIEFSAFIKKSKKEKEQHGEISRYDKIKAFQEAIIEMINSPAKAVKAVKAAMPKKAIKAVIKTKSKKR